MSQLTLMPEDVKWVKNSLNELGVMIGDRCFFLYKGESLVYDGSTDECKHLMVRPVWKREFGEVCKPLDMDSILSIPAEYRNRIKDAEADTTDGGRFPLPIPRKDT